MAILCNRWPERKASKMHFYELLDIYSDRPNPWNQKFSSVPCLPLRKDIGHRTGSESFPALLFFSCTLPAGQRRCPPVPAPSGVMQPRLGIAASHDFQIGKYGKTAETPTHKYQTSFLGCWGARRQPEAWRGLWSPSASATKKGCKKWINLAQILYWWDCMEPCETDRTAKLCEQGWF